MAFALGKYFTVITAVDNGGDETTKRFEMTAIDDTTASTDMLAIVAAFQGVSDLVVKSYYFYGEIVNGAFAYPASGVELQNQALLDFSIVGQPTKTAVISIPGIKPGAMVGNAGPSAEVVDPADAGVIAFVGLFQSGGKCTLSDGETAGGLIGGRRIHRRSSAG